MALLLLTGGTFEWSGDYSDSSQLWTSSLRTEVDTRALEATAQTAWLAGELSLTELLNVHRDARDDGLALLALERAARAAREELRRLTLEEAP